MAEGAGTVPTRTVPAAATRPTRRMTWFELFQISVYWMAINALWGGIDLQILPVRMTDLVCGSLSGAACLGHEHAIFGGLVVSKEIATAIVAWAGAMVALVVQPVAAAVSDYTRTRWGRRKPYIFVGTVLDVVFLAGLAWSNTFVAVFAFVMLLQFSSNFAQGPFQGYVPDLVPASQVGLASGLMGVMIIGGNLVGIAAAGLAVAMGDFRWGLAAVAVLELTTMVVTVIAVREPPGVAPARRSRSIVGAMRGTARDVLSHRSFVWLLGSRLFFLVATSMLTRMAQFYMRDSIGMTIEQAALAVTVVTGVVAITAGLAAFPAGAVSDRLGRKTVIYGACFLGFVGMAPVAFAQRDPALVLGTLQTPGGPVDAVFPLAALAIVLVGVGMGSFLAVDWALISDIIPKETTGRYMGISNVVTALASPFALLIGGVIAGVFNQVSFGLGPRLAFLVAAAFCVIAAVLLRPVDPRRWEDIHGPSAPVLEASQPADAATPAGLGAG